MKLAILGTTPLALEAALRFHLHGASFTWFNFEEANLEEHFQKYLSPDSYITDTGLKLLRDLGRPYSFSPSFTLDSWSQNYFKPLSEFLGTEQKLSPHEVICLAKRFLSPGESIAGKSRFSDLFRVIFLVNPQEFIKEQESTNPETFERLKQEVVDSLQTNIEMYEDFDLILDLRKSSIVTSISVTQRALGEGRIPKEFIKYGLDGLNEAIKINQDAQGVREIALIGSGALSAQVVCDLSDWLSDERSRLFVVTEESDPFQNFLDTGEGRAVSTLQSVLNRLDSEFENEINEFHSKLREWQELDDFVQVKMRKPVEPIPRLVYFSGHNATAVDQMLDGKRLFLTIEKPEFREGNKHPENNSLDLKTIGVDRMIVANKMTKPKLECHLDPTETGHFAVDITFPNISESWNKDLEKLKGVENEIFKLFSPVGAH